MRKKNVSEKEEQEETSSSQQEVAHHSREAATAAAAAGGEEEEEEEQGEEVKRAELQRSREEKELRNMALQRAPEEKRGLEEEGSAIRKSEVGFSCFLFAVRNGRVTTGGVVCSACFLCRGSFRPVPSRFLTAAITAVKNCNTLNFDR